MKNTVRKIKAVFVSGLNVDMNERVNDARVFESVKEAREFFGTKLLLNKSVFVPALGYYKLIVVKMEGGENE